MTNMAVDIQEIQMETLKTSEKLSMLEKNILDITEEVKRNSDDMKSKLQELLELLKNHTSDTTDATTTPTTTTTTTTTTTMDNLIRGQFLFLSESRILSLPTFKEVDCQQDFPESPMNGASAGVVMDNNLMVCGGRGITTCRMWTEDGWVEATTGLKRAE